MRVVIVAHNLSAGGGVSVGRNIFKSLLDTVPDWFFLIIHPENCGYEEVATGNATVSRFARRNGGVFKRGLFEFFVLPKIIKDFEPDVILCLGNMACWRLAYPQVMLFHNAYFVYPARHYGRSADLRLYLLVFVQKLIFRFDLTRIKHLLVQTETIRHRVEKLGFPSQSVSVLPNAVSFFLSADMQESIEEKIQTIRERRKSRILLCLGAYYTHKNFEFVGDLLECPDNELDDCLFVFTLDEHDSRVQSLLSRLSKINDGSNFLNVGPLKQDQLRFLFNEATCLFMPTLLESFSASYLEARVFGIPTVTTDFDFSREICGDEAFYFDANDMSSALRAINSAHVCAYDSAIQKAVVAATLPRTWSAICSEIADILLDNRVNSKK